MIDADIDDTHSDAKLTGQHRNRRTSAQKIVNHLRRHLTRIRTNSFFTHPMISAADKQDFLVNARAFLPCYQCTTKSEFFQPSETSTRLRQLV
jgi:hypothetical protein